MSVSLETLLDHLDELLAPGRFRDYCPNGLQVEGRGQVACLVTGVTASQALIDAAVECEADAILVHHGYFWKGENPVVTGMKRRRLGALLAHDISLLAYHLPLDAHPEYGNNARLAQLLGLPRGEALEPSEAGGVGSVASIPQALGATELVSKLRALTGREPLLIGDASDTFSRVAWCTGAAQGYIEAAVAAGADVFISGEISEQTVHIAREEGIAYIAAGHHATERYGVQALGEHLSAQFGLEHRFIDIDNPV